MDYNSLKMEQLGSVRDMFGLKGKKALVTGAAGGIGRSCAHAFAELGADVALMDISSRLTQLTGYAGYLETKFGIKAVPLTGDVADEESVDTFMEDAVREFGTLDILFSNAGIAGGVNRGSDISMEDWNKIIGINLTGMLLTGRYGANVMKRDGHGGSIIFTSSMSGAIINKKPETGARYAPGYPATKAAVRHLAKSMAMDYVEYGIRVNSISPGIILSGLHDGWDRAIMDVAARMIPMRRFGSLDEIMGVVAFLAGGLSSYMTGTDITVDGGYTVW